MKQVNPRPSRGPSRKEKTGAALAVLCGLALGAGAPALASLPKMGSSELQLNQDQISADAIPEHFQEARNVYVRWRLALTQFMREQGETQDYLRHVSAGKLDAIFVKMSQAPGWDEVFQELRPAADNAFALLRDEALNGGPRAEEAMRSLTTREHPNVQAPFDPNFLDEPRFREELLQLLKERVAPSDRKISAAFSLPLQLAQTRLYLQGLHIPGDGFRSRAFGVTRLAGDDPSLAGLADRVKVGGVWLIPASSHAIVAKHFINVLMEYEGRPEGRPEERAATEAIRGMLLLFEEGAR